MAYDEGQADRVRDALAGESGITEKRMFGGLAFLVDGNMTIAVRKDSGIMIRLPADTTEELLGPHVSYAIMGGRELRGWLVISEEGIASDVDLRDWTARTVAYARGLPPK